MLKTNKKTKKKTKRLKQGHTDQLQGDDFF